MPVYEARCNNCLKIHNYVSRVADYLNTPECCGAKTEKVILTPAMGIVDIPAYQSPISGKWINSRKQRNEDLVSNDCRPWEGMEQEQKEADRRRAHEEQKEDLALEKTIEQTIKELPDDKKKVLELT